MSTKTHHDPATAAPADLWTTAGKKGVPPLPVQPDPNPPGETDTGDAASFAAAPTPPSAVRKPRRPKTWQYLHVREEMARDPLAEPEAHPAPSAKPASHRKPTEPMRTVWSLLAEYLEDLRLAIKTEKTAAARAATTGLVRGLFLLPPEGE